MVALAEGTEGVQTLFDYFGGFADLAERRLRTPTDPERLFADDPLRMLRAARFAARLALVIDPAIEAATVAMAPRLEKVSAERIRGELDLLMVAPFPSVGLDFIVRTGLAEHFFPELPALQLEQDPIHRHKDVLAPHAGRRRQGVSPRLRLRLAALFHDVGKPATREHHRRGRDLPVPRGGRRQDDPKAHGGAATTRRTRSTRSPSSSSCTCASTPTSWAGPTARCGATCATRATCSRTSTSSRAATARRATLKKAMELAQVMDELEERIVELRDRGGPGRACARPSTAQR